MKYGWVDTDGKLRLDYHPKGDVYLSLLNNSTIGVPISRTFRFAGYKTSIVRFLLDNPAYMFESKTDNLHMRGGEEMDSPGEAVANLVAGKFAGAIMPDIPTLVTTAASVVASGVNKAAGSVARPGKFASFVDHRLNKRLIVDLNSMTSPKFNKYDSLKDLPKVVTFQNLAGYIHNHF